MTLIGARLMARVSGGKELQRGEATEWEIVEKLPDGRYALESRSRSDFEPVRIERTVDQLRARCWRRVA